MATSTHNWPTALADDTMANVLGLLQGNIPTPADINWDTYTAYGYCCGKWEARKAAGSVTPRTTMVPCTVQEGVAMLQDSKGSAQPHAVPNFNWSGLAVLLLQVLQTYLASKPG